MAFLSEKSFEKEFLAEKLLSVRMYNLNDTFMVFEDQEIICLDGGIEFVFPSKIISWAWTNFRECFDISTQTILLVFENTEVDYYAIEEDYLGLKEKVFNQKITAVDAKWSVFQDIDEDDNVSSEKLYVPNELFLTFENGATLQIASVEYELEEYNFTQPSYDLGAELMLAVNQRLEIKNPM